LWYKKATFIILFLRGPFKALKKLELVKAGGKGFRKGKVRS
jgi:hypothetical protein